MYLKKQSNELLQKFLRNVPLFRNISTQHAQRLTKDFASRRVRKDAHIVFQSDESTDLYIIVEGKVRVTLLSEDGDEFVLTDLHEGDFFGEMSLIDRNPRSATVVAEEDSTLAVLRREKFLEALHEDTKLGFELLTSLVQRLRQADEIIESFAFRDVRDRLLMHFTQCVRTGDETEEQNEYYRMKKRTHKELAERIGASREAVTKIMKALVYQKLLMEKDGYYWISSSILKEDKTPDCL